MEKASTTPAPSPLAQQAQGVLGRYRRYLIAFALAAATAAVFILAFTLYRGVFYIGSDYVHQQVPFLSYANQAIKSGDIWWSDRLDLGTPFVAGFSFYGIGSPFFWLSLLFKGQHYYLVAPFLLIVKFGVAGLAAFGWLRQYTKTDYAAWVGCLLYAFCGFQISTMNFHFADIVALFPFMLWALDAAVLRNRRYAFAIAVALCALCNWFFFFGQVIFLVMYFLVKLWSRQYALPGIKKLGRLAAESILGTCIGAVMWLPGFLLTAQSPRAAESFESLWRMLAIKPIYLAELVRGLLLPPEASFYRGFFMQTFFNGGELYLPLFGVVLAAAFVLRYRKSFEARMLLVCLVFMLVPVLNSLFVGLNAEYYSRWFYMPSLIMALASVKALEDDTVPIKRGALFYLGLWGLFALIWAWFTFYFKVTFFYNLVPVLVYSGISLAGFGITLFVRRFMASKGGRALLLAGVMGFAAVCGGYNIYLMQKTWSSSMPRVYYTQGSQLKLPKGNQYYRVQTGATHFNLAMMGDFPAQSVFSSTTSPSIFEFYDLVDQPRSVISFVDDAGYKALLSTRYTVRLADDGQGFVAEENPLYIPPGFVYRHYITPRQLEAVPPEDRHSLLLKALVLTEEQAQRYSNLLSPLPKEAFYTLGQTLAEDAGALRQTAAAYSAKDNTGYTFRLQVEPSGLVFLSIPWDADWQATVNGQPATIEKVDGGFMAVPCGPGSVELRLEYRPRTLYAGGLLSAGGLAALLAWALAGHIRARQRKNKP